MTGILENLKKRMDIAKAQIIDNSDGNFYCMTCGSEEELVEDINNKGIYYCLQCLEKSWRHDEMIYEGFEEAPEVGD